MNITPYLTFNGRCREALEFYAQHLGGKIEFLMTFGESPMAGQTPPEVRNHVMHATLAIDGSLIQASDAPPPNYQPTSGMSLAVSLDNVAEAERIFNGLSEGGQVTMPLQQTFWAARFGMLTDRFGTPWMINCEVKS